MQCCHSPHTKTSQWLPQKSYLVNGSGLPDLQNWICVTVICWWHIEGVMWTICILCDNWTILFQTKLLIFQEWCCVLRNILRSCKACSEAGSQHFKTLLLNKIKLNCKWKTGFNSWQIQAPYAIKFLWHVPHPAAESEVRWGAVERHFAMRPVSTTFLVQCGSALPQSQLQ